LTGIAAAGDELALGVALALDLGAAGEEDLLGEVEGFGFGVGEAVFSVVTDTDGSDLVVSRVVVSGGAAGDALSSCARASGAATNRAARQKKVIFIGSS
jgi:hypothetical protein